MTPRPYEPQAAPGRRPAPTTYEPSPRLLDAFHNPVRAAWKRICPNCRLPYGNWRLRCPTCGECKTKKHHWLPPGERG